MRCNFIYGVLSIFLLMSCAKEDEIKSSLIGTDWFEIQDKSGRFNHLAYEIYEATGMPIFVNDTLGVESRGKDAYGSPIVHYELFQVGYKVFAQHSEADIVLSSDTAAMVKAAELIRDKVIPRLPKVSIYRPYSLLLVDTLYGKDYGWQNGVGLGTHGKSDYAYKDMMGLVIGQLSEILNMSDDEQDYWVGRILATNVSSTIQEFYKGELEEFYRVSARTATATYHGTSYYAYLDGKPLDKNENYLLDYRTFGFTEWIWDGIYQNMDDRRVRRYPTKPMDVQNYIAMVYAYDQAKFEELYADWPLCIEKYKIMNEIVTKFEQRISK